MTEVNIPLLRKAVEWAEAEAAKPWEISQWSQGDWVTRFDPLDPVEPSPVEIEAGWASEGQVKSSECGTCFCIAGYVAVAIMGESPDVAFHVEGIAAKGLGIKGEVAESLFDCDNTIEDVRRIAESIAGERL